MALQTDQTGAMTLDQLLVVQEHDSAIDRLRHRYDNLPEQQALADCAEEQTHLETSRAEVVEQRHTVAREQKRHEDEVAIVEARQASENERLYSGSVTAHKDLQAIQSELKVLADRQSKIEDQVLEVMERAEPLDAALADFDTKLADVAERSAKIEEAIAAAQLEIEAEIETEQTARAESISGVGAELVTAYEKARSDLGGVGIARLNGKTCEGCRLQLAAVAYDKVRKAPSDVVPRCPECERILVVS